MSDTELLTLYVKTSKNQTRNRWCSWYHEKGVGLGVSVSVHTIRAPK
jgi:hypothetical protein